MERSLERPTGRRGFLAGAAATVALFLTGCGRSDRTVGATPTTTFVDPKHPPTFPELSEMEPRFVEDARTYLVAVPVGLRDRARALLPPEVREGLDAGLLALSDVCPDDQIQLEFCASSRWFECKACGSKFDILGGFHAGPAPRGMTMFGLSVGPEPDREVSVETHPKLAGLPPGTLLARQEPLGPFCA